MIAQASNPPHAAEPIIELTKLHEIMPHLSASNGLRYIDPLNRAMVEFQINNRLRKAAFLAQIAHESNELIFFEECASGWHYDKSQNPKKARELGNTQAGDGPRYKGRGPIQLTGRSNYRHAGEALGLNLEGNPALAATPTIGFRTSSWFWFKHGLNGLADRQDFHEITHRINGGYRGYKLRVEFYERALRVIR